MKTLLMLHIFVLLLAESPCFSQEPIEGIRGIDLDQLMDTETAKRYFTFDNRYEGVKGSLYYLEDWTPGKITLKSGKVYEFDKLNLNLYENLVEFVARRDFVYVIATSDVEQLTIERDDEQVKFTTKKLSEDEKPLMRIVVPGSIALYEYPQVIFKEANYKGAYPTGNPYDEFINSTQYYIQLKDGELIKLRTNKRFGRKNLNDEDWDKAKKYMGANDIDLKGIEGWIKLLNYLNLK